MSNEVTTEMILAAIQQAAEEGIIKPRPLTAVAYMRNAEAWRRVIGASLDKCAIDPPRYENGCTGDPVLVPGGQMSIDIHTSESHAMRPDGSIEILESGTCEGGVKFGDKPFTGRTERNKP